MKAAIYSRFSTDRQTDSSIADQVRVCSEYARREGMQVTELFEDQGISGAAIGNRPSVIRMREAALARRFDVLLVMDLSRLSRSQADLPKLIDQLLAKGVRVVGVQDGYDSSRRGHKLQAGLHGILGEAFREMVKDRTYAALETRAKNRRPTGGRAYGYVAATKSASGDIEINELEAAVVRELFERFADGESCLSIASDLNHRGVPSPGSTWNRRTRRASGWMASAIRSMLRNPIYKGEVIWNTSEWRKDPDSGKRARVMRPASEWVRHHNEDLRIVSTALWERAQRRTRGHGSEKLKAGGKARYLLSGLLRCEVCNAHFIMADNRSYACSGHLNGRACSNSVRVRRDHIEAVLLEPIRSGLLAPERVEEMRKEMQRAYVERVGALRMQAAQAPRELQEIDARLDRLRERLQRGDPDMTTDEIQAAIDRAQSKRRDLAQASSLEEAGSAVMAMLPRAAERYRQQIAKGLDGDPRAALKARVILRDLFGGKIRLVPGNGSSLFAEFDLHPAALLRGAGSNGSGGRI